MQLENKDNQLLGVNDPMFAQFELSEFPDSTHATHRLFLPKPTDGEPDKNYAKLVKCNFLFL